MGRPRSPEPPRLSPGVDQEGREAELQHRPGTHAELPAERVQQELDAVRGTCRAIRYEDRSDCSTSALSSRRAAPQQRRDGGRRAPVRDLHSRARPPCAQGRWPPCDLTTDPAPAEYTFCGAATAPASACLPAVNHPCIHLYLWHSRQEGYDCERIYSFRDIFKCSVLFRSNPCTYFNVLLSNLFCPHFLNVSMIMLNM